MRLVAQELPVMTPAHGPTIGLCRPSDREGARRNPVDVPVRPVRFLARDGHDGRLAETADDHAVGDGHQPEQDDTADGRGMERDPPRPVGMGFAIVHADAGPCETFSKTTEALVSSR